jgi:hypothetical protein
VSITAILVVLIVPCLYAIANLVDKFQLHGSGDDSKPGAIMALGSVFGIIFLTPLGLWIYFTGRSIGGLESILPLIFNEILYIAAIWIYLEVLEERDPEDVVSWFQTIPIFGLVGATLIIGETISIGSAIAIILLMIGGFILSYKKDGVDVKLIIMMILSSGIFALYEVIFAEFGRDIDSMSAIFINLVGKAIWSCLFLVGKQERRGFFLGLRTRFKVQSIGEITTIVADVAMCLFLLYFPVVIVQGVCCTQPLFVFIGAILVAKRYPEINLKNITSLTKTQKVIGIILMIIGGIILSV